VLDMVEAHLPRNRGTVVLHWFTCSKSEARRATNLGCYFSVNLEMLRSDRGRALVSGLQMDRLLTETDGPFTNIDGRPSEPADVYSVVEAVARLRGLPIEDVSRNVRANLQTVLR
jgi:TatD DNase family protein